MSTIEYPNPTSTGYPIYLSVSFLSTYRAQWLYSAVTTNATLCVLTAAVLVRQHESAGDISALRALEARRAALNHSLKRSAGWQERAVRL